MERTAHPASPNKIRSSLQNENWTFTQVRYAPDLALSLHAHRKAGIYLALGGMHTVTSRKTVHPVERGTLVFHPAEELHSCRFLTEVKTFEMLLEPAWLKQLHPHLTMLDRPIYQHSGMVAQLAARAYEEFRLQDTFSTLALEGLVLEILPQLARQNISDRGVGEGRPPRWLREAYDLLHERFADSLTLDEIAQTAGVHPAHLGRMFRRYYHRTIGEYLRVLRLKHACSLLSTTAAPLVEIALSCGYSEQSNFTAAFKRHTGLTPNAYRKIFSTRSSHIKTQVTDKTS